MSPKDFSPTVFTLKKPRSFDWQRLKTRCIQRIDMERQHNGERPVDEQEIKIYEQQELENSFRSHFARVEHELQAALAYKNPDVFWRLWLSATEEAIVQACAHNSSERRLYVGRGSATHMLRKHKASQALQDHEQRAAFSTKATEQHRLERQIHKIVHHARKSKQSNRNAWPTDVRNTWENAAHNEMWTQHTNMTNETPASWVALMKNLHRAIRNIEQHVQRLIHDEYKERRKLFAAKLADHATGSLEFRTIRDTQARPIQFLADGEGTLHTDPMMTDSIMTRA